MFSTALAPRKPSEIRSNAVRLHPHDLHSSRRDHDQRRWGLIEHGELVLATHFHHWSSTAASAGGGKSERRAQRLLSGVSSIQGSPAPSPAHRTDLVDHPLAPAQAKDQHQAWLRCRNQRAHTVASQPSLLHSRPAVLQLSHPLSTTAALARQRMPPNPALELTCYGRQPCPGGNALRAFCATMPTLPAAARSSALR